MQWGLIGQRDGLCHEDEKYLWAQADIGGDGVVDFEEFQVNFVSLMFFSFAVAHVTQHFPQHRWCYIVKTLPNAQ